MDLRWSVEVKGGETRQSARVLNGRRGAVTHVSLVHPPPSAVGGQRVVVDACVKTVDGTLALASLTSESPRAELPRPVLVMGLDLFCSRVRRQGGDPADGDEAVAVRFEGRFNDGYVLPPPSPPTLEGEEDHPLWSSEDDDDDNSGDEDDEPVGSDSEDCDDDDSSSSEEEESDDEVDEIDGQAAMESSADNDVLPHMVHPRKFVPEGQFTGGSAPPGRLLASCGSASRRGKKKQTVGFEPARSKNLCVRAS